MAYITEYFLRQKASDTILENAARQMAQKTASLSYVKKIFLSHSHKDRELAKGLKNYLSSLGIDLYIDWLDASMPPKVSKETAENIKRRIGNSDHVLVLATKSAINSRWVPWEIGISDIKKTPKKVSIVPVADATGRHSGNEYLQLYRRIIIAENGTIAVFEPNETKGWDIQYWLKNLI